MMALVNYHFNLNLIEKKKIPRVVACFQRILVIFQINKLIEKKQEEDLQIEQPQIF